MSTDNTKLPPKLDTLAAQFARFKELTCSQLSEEAVTGIICPAFMAGATCMVDLFRRADSKDNDEEAFAMMQALEAEVVQLSKLAQEEVMRLITLYDASPDTSNLH